MPINPSLVGPEPVAASGPSQAAPRARHRAPTPRRFVQPLRWGWYPRFKAVGDFALAAVLAVFALPLVALAALAVKLTSRGPAFYTQVRVGRGGKLFTIIKIRTMIDNCESLTGPRWSMPGDPRVTPVGWFLRKSHIDELPQLINVLRGEMSLIGPRPERPEFLPELEQQLPSYRQRLNVLPGVTGLAQVQLPPDTDVESVRRKLAHDLYYIRHLSPWLDLKLMAATGVYALGAPFGAVGRWLALPEAAEIERGTRDLVPEAAVGRARAA